LAIGDDSISFELKIVAARVPVDGVNCNLVDDAFNPETAPEDAVEYVR
jgi:hypothetical protein